MEERIKEFKRCKADAAQRGMWNEVKRINKILALNGVVV